MKSIRYFRDKDCYWKFEGGEPPMTKTGYDSPWRESYFRTAEEFLADPGHVEEVGSEDVEQVRDQWKS